MDRRDELREFLRARRSRLRPGDGDIPAFAGARRVPGLRREELALLAGISVDYYVRLEQGRVANPGETVLDALAQALQLDDAERDHLFHLARPARTRPRPVAPQRVRPTLRVMLEQMSGTPAFITGRRSDVLAWNRLAAALITDFDAIPAVQRNMCRFMFLDETARSLYREWEKVARVSVNVLRLRAGQYPHDPELASLVGELSVHSPEFRRWWADHQVAERTHGTKAYQHPLVGELTVAYENFRLADNGELTLTVYSAPPGSPSRTALDMLASLTSPGPTAAASPAPADSTAAAAPTDGLSYATAQNRAGGAAIGRP
ncbi:MULTISPECIES: helix-turn-helix transcriptional regulator [unclassified Frankia]|uniref:helix-turn-helix transcriptional regulator n=1 Tax=unclassified Frankia TaxID=2632575 RepID=UPI002AD4D483|nr:MULTISPECIES: helix-turn-helix transcriptional regulator [unclassified Frankia]